MQEFEKSKVARTAVLVLLLVGGYLAVQIINGLKEYQYIGGGVPVSNTISVSGEGEVFAVPDIATFTFSIIEEKKTAKEAQEIGSEKENAIVQYLKEAGIEERDIKTVGYNVYPKYEWSREICTQFSCQPGKQTLTGFEFSETILVKVRDTDKAGNLLSGVGERGVSNISGLEFTIDDQDELMKEARKKAIDEAREKAEDLANDLGVRLVRVVAFSENTGAYPPIPVYYMRDSVMGMGGMAESSVKSSVLPTGENKIVANVSITYEIR